MKASLPACVHARLTEPGTSGRPPVQLVCDNLWARVKAIRDEETAPLPAAIVDRVLADLPMVERRRYRKALIERLEIYDG